MRGLLVIALFISTLTFGQSDSLRLIAKAQQHFNQFSYQLALDTYDKIQTPTADLKRNVAISAWKVGDLVRAERTYSALIEMDGVTDEDLINYYLVLREVEAYENSEAIMEKYGKKNPKDSRYLLYTKSKGNWNNLLKNDSIVRLHELRMNGGHSDFGVTYYGNGVVFCSSHEHFKPVRRTYNANQLPFLDLYEATVYDTQFVNIKPFEKKLNSKFHEGPATFNSTEDVIYFSKTTSRHESDGRQYFHLFYSELNAGSWSKPTQIPFDTSAWNSGHPCLSKDGKWLYFSSTMAGGKGGADIWKVEVKGDGNFGKPINMAEVNTEGNEVYPYIHPDNDLFFFSSDGRNGLGGLDVYMVEMHGDHMHAPQNMKAPINTNRDDFAFILAKDKKSGYLSSNRDDGRGSDDIYFIEVLKDLGSK